MWQKTYLLYVQNNCWYNNLIELNNAYAAYQITTENKCRHEVINNERKEFKKIKINRNSANRAGSTFLGVLG